MSWSRVQFLETGDSYFRALFDALAGARHSILLEFYIFRMDELGREVLGALADCERRGVKVFLRLDAVGCHDYLQQLTSYCLDHKIRLDIYHPLPFEAVATFFPRTFARADSLLKRFRQVNRRTHRKIVVIDEEIAFTGGMNVANEYCERFSGPLAWHDLSLRLEGEGVAELVHAFWFRSHPYLRFLHCLANYTWQLKQRRHHYITRSVRRAAERVWVITPYFAPTPQMMYQLRKTARRGVDVRILVGRKTDIWASKLAAYGLFRHLLAWRVKVYEYDGPILHRKLWVFDRSCLAGSTNLNHRSFLHDQELDVILTDAASLQTAERLFLKDQSQSRPITTDVLAHQSLPSRFLAWIVSWFTYWL